MRMVQALGAAMLQSNSIALISTSTPPAHLGKALGVQGAAQALGLAMGPTVGGLLLALGSWRLIFMVNVPVSVIGFASGWYLLPRSRNLAARVPLDWAGLAMFVPAISGLLLFLSLGSRDGFLHPTVFPILLIAVALVDRLRRPRAPVPGTPLMDLALFGNRTYRNCVLGGLIAFLVMFGVMFVVPFLLEDARHTSPASAGLLLTVLPLMLGIVAPFAGRIADRVGPHTLKVAGMACVAARNRPDGGPRRAVDARSPDRADAVRHRPGRVHPGQQLLVHGLRPTTAGRRGERYDQPRTRPGHLAGSGPDRAWSSGRWRGS